MSRDYRLYLEDMLEATAMIERYTRGLDFAAFSGDKIRIDAVMRNFEIVGEAAKKHSAGATLACALDRVVQDFRAARYPVT
jgi:uncharacterized protein with HEPN domain